MNNLVTITNNKELTMSSQEIAELTNKEHKNVKRDICAMFEQLKIDVLKFERIYLDTRNRQQIEFQLPKIYIECLLMGYSAELRMRVLERLHELESGQTITPERALNDPAVMRGILLNYCEKVLDLEQKVSEMTPQVDALKRISASNDTLTMTQAAKVLGMKRCDLTAKLHEAGWIYRQNASWVAYDQYIKNGCLAYKEATYTDESTEMKTIRPYCHVTQKGMTKLAISFNQTSH